MQTIPAGSHWAMLICRLYVPMHFFLPDTNLSLSQCKNVISHPDLVSGIRNHYPPPLRMNIIITSALLLSRLNRASSFSMPSQVIMTHISNLWTFPCSTPFSKWIKGNWTEWSNWRSMSTEERAFHAHWDLDLRLSLARITARCSGELLTPATNSGLLSLS